LDKRYYSSIEEMRNDLRTVVSEYIAAYPECADQVTRIPFYFCDGQELGLVPLELTPANFAGVPEKRSRDD
jgi:hypothetical protein